MYVYIERLKNFQINTSKGAYSRLYSHSPNHVGNCSYNMFCSNMSRHETVHFVCKKNISAETNIYDMCIYGIYFCYQIIHLHNMQQKYTFLATYCIFMKRIGCLSKAKHILQVIFSVAFRSTFFGLCARSENLLKSVALKLVIYVAAICQFVLILKANNCGILCLLLGNIRLHF